MKVNMYTPVGTMYDLYNIWQLRVYYVRDWGSYSTTTEQTEDVEPVLF